ncbi:MAG: hypothetical protein NTV51_26950 [Verrucomicrobia bacterium]|nr:hypothetical protein [Verrucomicrobiota bacterium]
MSLSAPAPLPLSAPVRALLWATVFGALVLIAHNFCLSLLPDVSIPFPPAAIRAEPNGHAFSIAFDHSPADTLLNPRSRVTLTEDGRPLIVKLRLPNSVLAEGEGSWCHVPGRIIFSVRDRTDPRTNGRSYVAHSPVLYSRNLGYAALAVLVGALYLLRRGTGHPSAPASSSVPLPPAAARRFRLHVTLAGLVFLAGLYCATGTLAPYANTLLSDPDPATGYLYNMDHSFHRATFAFVDGEPRAAWQDAIMLRRVLYAVLAWPWMKGLSFELGGVLFNLLANLLGFAAGVMMVRRHVGERGAIFAGWLLALYPGAAYWAGQPYAYALIFPLGIAAFWLLLELPAARLTRVAWLSLALGVIYLSYDFHAYFLPASLLLLVWHRCFSAAALSVVLQVLPLGGWLWILRNIVQLPLENSNTVAYRAHFAAFFDPASFAGNLGRLAALPETAADCFFGANFLFLPLLAAIAWALDLSWKDLTRHRAVPAVLAAGLALFLFCNVPPPHNGPWNFGGSWIARIYQPLFPALVLLLAWWWQERLPTAPFARGARLALVGLTLGGNALICFGPVAGVPLPVAETAFYRFYDHTDLHWVYERNLRLHGRRPLGFPRPGPGQ